VARRADVTEAALRRRFRVVESTLRIAGRAISILHPASAEDLINEADFERDERLPYWAELWPSSRILAARLLGMSSGGRRLLELGCGAGLLATCASLAGFDVCASDYYEDALRFAGANAARNGSEIHTQLLDWRSLPDDMGRFDVVVASDVLYEQPYGLLVASAIASTLAPDGIALVADPGRVAEEAFVRSVAEKGLRVSARPTFPFVEGQIRQTITVFEIRW
jgi:2-polyprenyl-3-methyl-5-hydroxy-6-metoxy-1,4-benzoquinol methylase